MGVSGLVGRERYSNFSAQEITHFFMEWGKLTTVPKGTTLFTPGERGDQVYYVTHGEVKIYRSTNEGKEIIMELLGPGGVIGDSEALSGLEWKNTAVTKRDTIVHVLSRRTLLERIEKDRKIGAWLLERLARKQLETENLMEGLLFKSANAKVAQVLLDLSERYGVSNDEGLLIDYLITHQEIGNTIATTRETVSYAFMEFRQAGLIDTVKRRTVIKDREALLAVTQQ
ncbi:MAG: Crp/Fnr family transcriptional regulator [bacterium]|nr:Crp/Fnr family transcriptional regulator [bacterium]